MNDQELVVKDTSLSVNLDDHVLESLSKQRSDLKKFISKQLQKDVDYGIIPGVKKDSLFKPGAEKLANIFKLGSRIVKNERTVDIKENFAMFAVTVEVFHLPTGTAISQCEGIANSHEKKYRTRMNYKTQQNEDTPVGDVLNTLTKMAQKRAYVGAVLIACGASDFFTQDMEDVDRAYIKPEAEKPKPSGAPSPIKTTAQRTTRDPITESKSYPDTCEGEFPDDPEYADPKGSYVCKIGKEVRGQTLNQMGTEKVAGLLDWVIKEERKKPLTGDYAEYKEEAKKFLNIK